MVWSVRIRSAARAATLHFGLSLLVAGAVAWLVFRIWYPTPFQEITGGRNLFLILMLVDVVCGPVLTLVLYDPSKSRFKWRVDLALIVVTQLGALAYGLSQVAAARPIFVAFEGDRFRVVQAFDIDKRQLHEAPEGMRSLPFGGPQPIGVRLAQPSDPDYLNSLQLSLQGLPPAFRPSRWEAFEEQMPSLTSQLKPLMVLRQNNPERTAELEAALGAAGLKEEEVGYLPLVRDQSTDWVALVRHSNGRPFAYVHIDGW